MNYTILLTFFGLINHLGYKVNQILFHSSIPFFSWIFLVVSQIIIFFDLHLRIIYVIFIFDLYTFESIQIVIVFHASIYYFMVMVMVRARLEFHGWESTFVFIFLFFISFCLAPIFSTWSLFLSFQDYLCLELWLLLELYSYSFIHIYNNWIAYILNSLSMTRINFLLNTCVCYVVIVSVILYKVNIIIFEDK